MRSVLYYLSYALGVIIRLNPVIRCTAHTHNNYGQLLEQLSVASLSRPILSFLSVTHCYCYTLSK